MRNELGSEPDSQVHSLQGAKSRPLVFYHQPLMVWGQIKCKLTSKKPNHTTDGTFVKTLQEKGRGERERQKANMVKC